MRYDIYIHEEWTSIRQPKPRVEYIGTVHAPDAQAAWTQARRDFQWPYGYDMLVVEEGEEIPDPEMNRRGMRRNPVTPKVSWAAGGRGEVGGAIARNPMSIEQAIRTVAARAPSPAAKAYANSVNDAIAMYGEEGLRYQVNYILANLGSWKGELARETKAFMRSWLKSGSSSGSRSTSASRSDDAIPAQIFDSELRSIVRSGDFPEWASDTHVTAHERKQFIRTYHNAKTMFSGADLVERAKKTARLAIMKALVAENEARSGLSSRRKKNPALMVISNPKPRKISKPNPKAVKEYKKFHMSDPAEATQVMLPDGWPKTLICIGTVDRLDVQDASGKEISKRYSGDGVKVCMSTSKKELFILGNKSLGLKNGTAMRIDYTVPKTSGRNKWSAKWWHPHDTGPKFTLESGGRAARVKGPKLKINKRGIIG